MWKSRCTVSGHQRNYGFGRSVGQKTAQLFTCPVSVVSNLKEGEGGTGVHLVIMVGIRVRWSIGEGDTVPFFCGTKGEDSLEVLKSLRIQVDTIFYFLLLRSDETRRWYRSVSHRDFLILVPVSVSTFFYTFSLLCHKFVLKGCRTYITPEEFEDLGKGNLTRYRVHTRFSSEDRGSIRVGSRIEDPSKSRISR